MQFVANGPNIPEALLQAHEEGRVVFFCGAGISYPAQLPDYKGLVDKVYNLVGTRIFPNEKEAYNQRQYDVTLDLLERRFPGQRIGIRKAVVETLKPNLRIKGASNTHTALLQLARDREGALRMVTTNFDRIFELVAKKTKQKLPAYAAPMLPIPKKSRWNGLVYLHGLLPVEVNDTELNRLVLTSGDFGLAYLTERWAARFVSELFRNYIVCFIGYSINDPILRYMMDALAADRMLGEVTPKAYALADCESGKEHNKIVEWEAKGVTPILYEVPSSSKDHSLMHKTLKSWAEIYRDGIFGKERIVDRQAFQNPSFSTPQDDFVSRMLWALSDESGLPAKRFAELNPVPSLAWLDILSEDRNQQSDLVRFVLPTHTEANEEFRFSLLRRPTQYTKAPWMSPVSEELADSEWDAVMLHLSRWLIRHLNDPNLIIWLVQRGGQLHNRLRWLIEVNLNDFARFEREGKTDELEKIRANAPNAIPGPQMKTLWRLFLIGLVKSPRRDLDFHVWKNRLKREGLSTTLRIELRKLLSPKVLLKPVNRYYVNELEGPPKHLRQIVDWELRLAINHIHSQLSDLDDKCWRKALPNLLDDFQHLLRDALDLINELGEADYYNDRSYWDLPSITPHWQNHGFHDWVVLIEMLRDSWLITRDSDPKRATLFAQGWYDMPYPTFKRMALFSASQDNCITPTKWVNWLIKENAWWLWSPETKRETMRLLVLQGVKLSSKLGRKLEKAILKGPPRKMYPEDIVPERWQALVDKSIWLRLAKLQKGGRILGESALERFTELSTANSEWKLSGHERDEFSHWMSGTGDPDYEENRDIDIAPKNRRDLVKWLRQPPSKVGPFFEDTWPETCRTRFFHSFFALCDLSREAIWPIERWRVALQVWSEDSNLKRSWRFAAPLVKNMPDDVLKDADYSVTRWLKEASKSTNCHETILLTLSQRLLSMDHHDGVETDQPVTRALNHPVGHVAEALMNLWFRRDPNDNDTLPHDIEPFFTQLCDTTIEQYRHGRVLLASRLIALFRVDPHWTVRYLLPLFDWKISPIEAKAAWEGFLWSPRLHKQLLIAFKSQFLDTARHYTDLGEHKNQFVGFLTYTALEKVDGFTPQDFQKAFEALPQEGLLKASQVLSEALNGAGEQREEYWKNRIQPFWHNIWPKSLELVSSGIAESLARMSIEARGQFPDAFSAAQDWLQSIKDPHFVVHLLHKSGLCERFPKDALRFLDVVINNQTWTPRELNQCLMAIAEASPALEQDHSFKQLIEYLRRHGL